MKRQKRDLTERAYKRGYMAGLKGKSKDLCPNGKPEMQQEWINGWREGRTDHWDGLSGVSAIHRMPNVSA